jgi:hypothetical protein
VACMRWMRVRWDGSSMDDDLWSGCEFSDWTGVTCVEAFVRGNVN